MAISKNFLQDLVTLLFFSSKMVWMNSHWIFQNSIHKFKLVFANSSPLRKPPIPILTFKNFFSRFFGCKFELGSSNFQMLHFDFGIFFKFKILWPSLKIKLGPMYTT